MNKIIKKKNKYIYTKKIMSDFMNSCTITIITLYTTKTRRIKKRISIEKKPVLCIKYNYVCY